MYDVVFFSHGDWANIGAHLAEALRIVGVSAVSRAAWDLKPDYPIKSKLYEHYKEVVEDLENAKVIFLMHGRPLLQDGVSGIPASIAEGKLVCTFHGGPPLINLPKGGIVEKGFFGRYTRRGLDPVHFIQMPKLYNTCKDLVDRIHLLSPPVDTMRLRTEYFRGGRKVVVGHFPRNTGNSLKTKGYDKVVRVFEQLTYHFEYHVATEFISWWDHIDRIRGCDIYVEKLSELVQEWGMAALEAAALGKIVITNFAAREVYEKFYGPSPIIEVSDPYGLYDVLLDMESWSSSRIREKQEETRIWAEKYHSFPVVGERLKRILHFEGVAL